MNLIIKVDTMKRFTFLCAENQILDRRQLDSLVGGKRATVDVPVWERRTHQKGPGLLTTPMQMMPTVMCRQTFRRKTLFGHSLDSYNVIDFR